VEGSGEDDAQNVNVSGLVKKWVRLDTHKSDQDAKHIGNQSQHVVHLLLVFELTKLSSTLVYYVGQHLHCRRQPLEATVVEKHGSKEKKQ
jgi:hypothetical protein